METSIYYVGGYPPAKPIEDFVSESHCVVIHNPTGVRRWCWFRGSAERIAKNMEDAWESISRYPSVNGIEDRDWAAVLLGVRLDSLDSYGYFVGHPCNKDGRKK